MAINQIPLNSWYKPVLMFAGLVTFGRGLLELYRPQYWDPRTPLDYAAVAGTSLMLLLIALGLWGFLRQQPVFSSRAARIWRAGIVTSSISAAAIGVSNFLEDGLGINGLMYFWGVGIVILFASLLVAGSSAFWVDGLPRLTGVLLLMSAVGLLFIASVGWFSLGFALLILGLVNSTKPVRHSSSRN